MAGIDTNGFTIKTLDEIKSEIEADLKAELGATLNTSAASVFGQLIGVMAGKLNEMWQLSEAVYRSQYAASASGEALENVGDITGVLRLPATKSQVTLIATGTNGTVLPLGRIAKVPNSATQRFLTKAGATIVTATSWAPTTGYVIGDIRTNATRIYYCITAGTSAGAGGPTTTAADITDGTVHWRYTGEGAGAVSVAAEAENTGPINGNTGTITEIVTPVAGWSSVNNPADAVVGRNIESDADYRLRRKNLQTITGDATFPAVRSDVLAVENVIACTLFENNTDITDVDGVPPHSVEALVSGGDDDDIRDALFNTVAAGIRTHGGVSGSVVDSEGASHTIKFSRPTPITIHVIVNVDRDPATFPADGVTQIKNAVKAHGDALGAGGDVITSAFYPTLFEISGVLDVVSILVGFSDPPTLSANLTIAAREIASFDTANIDVNLS